MKVLFLTGHSERDTGNVKKRVTEFSLARKIICGLNEEVYDNYRLPYNDFVIDQLQFIHSNKDMYDLVICLHFPASNDCKINYGSVVFNSNCLESQFSALKLKQSFKGIFELQLVNDKVANHRNSFLIKRSALPTLILEPFFMSFHKIDFDYYIHNTIRALNQFKISCI